MEKIPYDISYHFDAGNPIEQGYLYGDGIPTPSAKILYETFLKDSRPSRQIKR